MTTPDTAARDPEMAALCPAPSLGAICLTRLPCSAHGVHDADDAVLIYGCVYEQAEGELHMHIEPRVGKPDA